MVQNIITWLLIAFSVYYLIKYIAKKISGKPCSNCPQCKTHKPDNCDCCTQKTTNPTTSND